MKTVIKVENVSKDYRLGEFGTGTIARDLNAWFAKIQGKENPNLQINSRESASTTNAIHSALNNVSFEVNEGDVLGIIGRNGAGKSTILKILSRVTTPTSGVVKVRGRIASLLEVGTGFHPELSGRDNVYLNGAILGMKKQEIKNKFDEIVDFSGVEKFIDTPVKRYSSGMYVRLAFAVAAHLEPEILVVDEVLAVGDIAFQNKCLGKMSEVSKQGRTILFVSHYMQAMSQLCTRGIVLQEGVKTYDGDIQTAIRHYLNNSVNTSGPVFDFDSLKARTGTGLLKFTKLEIYNKNELSNNFVIGDDMELHISVACFQPIKNIAIAVRISRFDEIILANVENIDSDYIIENIERDTVFSVKFRNLCFYPETYKLSFWIASSLSHEAHDFILNCAEFNVIDGSPLVKRRLGNHLASIYLTPEWNKKEI